MEKRDAFYFIRFLNNSLKCLLNSMKSKQVEVINVVIFLYNFEDDNNKILNLSISKKNYFYL